MRLAKRPILEQLATQWEAEALDCDPDEDSESGGLDSDLSRLGFLDPTAAVRLYIEAAAEADRQLRSRATHEQRGHGNERLAELEDLLSHDSWEPAGPKRVALWREHRLLLEADSQLRSHLVPPADVQVEQSASLRHVRL